MGRTHRGRRAAGRGDAQGAHDRRLHAQPGRSRRTTGSCRRRWPSPACIRSARRSSAATSPSPPISASPPRPASFEGLTEIPFASVPGERAASGGSALAYKFIATAPAAAPAWKLSVTTEAVEPWLRAEIMNTITLTETLVSGRTLVKYDIANAPGEGVPRARAGGLQERRDHRRADPPPGRDQRRVARRAAKQGARGLPADRDVGIAARPARRTSSSWRASRRWAWSARPVTSPSSPGRRCR